MRNIYDVIEEKEALLATINEELRALRTALRLLTEDAAEGATEAYPKIPPLREEAPKTATGKVKNFP